MWFRPTFFDNPGPPAPRHCLPCRCHQWWSWHRGSQGGLLVPDISAFLFHQICRNNFHGPETLSITHELLRRHLSFITWDRFFSVLSADLPDRRALSDNDMWCQCGNPADLTLPILWLFQFRGPQCSNHHRQEDRSAWKQPWRYFDLLGKMSCLIWGNWLKSTGRSNVMRAMSYLMTPRPRLM